MEAMTDEQILREIEPTITAAYESHMKQQGVEPIDSVYFLSSAAHTVDRSTTTEINGPADPEAPVADPLEYGHVLRASLNTHMDDMEANGIDARPIIASSFLVGLLTEENLPYYTEENGRMARKLEAMYTWLKEWTAEEKGHGVVIRDYAVLTGLIGRVIPHRNYQEGLNAQMRGGMRIRLRSAAQGFSYLALQELATYESHVKTGWLMDKLGKRVLRKVGGQELNHSEFYSKMLGATMDVDPDNTVVAMRDQYDPKTFDMPGGSIPGFNSLARAIAVAGILDGRILNRLKAEIIGDLKLDRRTFTTDEAKQAQEDLVSLLDPEVQAAKGDHATLERMRDRDIKKARAADKLTPLILGRTVRIPENKRSDYQGSKLIIAA